MPIPQRLALALLAVSFSAATLAQPPASTPPPGSHPITLDIVVTPKSGKPVADLHQQDFTIFDNKVARPIASFAAVDGQQAPLEVVLLIDAVNTNYSNLGFERQQAETFLKSNDGHLSHPVSLAIFTDTAFTLQDPPSTDGNQISANLDQSIIGLRNIHRGSDFGDEDRLGLSLKALHLLLAKESTLPGRKLIFWISPGWPAFSGPNVFLDNKQEQQIYSEIISLSTAMRRNQITLYSIDPLGPGQNVAWELDYLQYLDGVKNSSHAQIGDLALQVLAVQTGGLAISASNDIAAGIQRSMADTEAWYRITYDAPPADQPNQYRRIDVKLSTPGLIARTRTGYYAQP